MNFLKEYASLHPNRIAIAASISVPLFFLVTKRWRQSTLTYKDSTVVASPKIQGEQSIAIRTENEKGETPVYRNRWHKETLVDSVDSMTTLNQLWRYAVSNFGSKNFVGQREILSNGRRGKFVFHTYSEIDSLAHSFAKGLSHALGVRPGHRIAFYSRNRVEFKIGEIACHMASFVSVPLFDSLSTQNVKFVLTQSQVSVAFCSRETFDKLMKSIALIPHESRTIKHVILMDEVLDISLATKLGLNVHHYQDIITAGQVLQPKGKSPMISEEEITPETIVSIMYTSGTSGESKGVLLTNRNCIAAAAGHIVNEVFDSKSELIYLSFLPLAHVMEQSIEFAFCYYGGTIGFFSGEIRTILDDYQLLQPTIVIGAPRHFQKIYDKVISNNTEMGKVQRFLFNRAYQSKKKALEKGVPEGTNTTWDALILKRIRSKIFGDRVKQIVSGSAPLSPDVSTFLKIVITPNVVEGYGLTETTAAGSVQKPGDYFSGRIGPPSPCCEIKLVDIPEMNYLSTDKPCPRGEIYIKGAVVSPGYFNNKEKTAESFVDGWFKTGDVGQRNEDGTFSIIDRKKNIFKLNQGVYVAPEKLENLYSRTRIVSQCFIYGDPTQSFLVAIVVPEPDAIYAFANYSLLEGSFKELCQNLKVRHYVLDQMQLIAEEEHLNGYEYVKGVYLETEQFSAENGLLTPTMKLKRLDVIKKYSEIIKQLYEKPIHLGVAD